MAQGMPCRRHRPRWSGDEPPRSPNPEPPHPSPAHPRPHGRAGCPLGILAPGHIAQGFASALRARTRQEIVAVASRDLGRAQAFAGEFGIGTAYGAYADLLADPDVDVVYVASPHSQHHEQALMALAAGKPVLVEKAFTRNATEAREVVAAARANGLFCMEAMWTRFLPHVDVLRQLLESGDLGEVQTVFADHGQPLYPGGPQRLSDPALAGGALLDLGIYPISFASMVLGGLASVRATGTLTAEGVDAQEAVTVTGAHGGIGVLHATMLARTATVASVIGTAARVDLATRFYGPTSVRLTLRDGSDGGGWEPPDRGHGLHFEACEVARCLTEGRTESAWMPLDKTVRIMETMDEVRRQLGVTFPGE